MYLKINPLVQTYAICTGQICSSLGTFTARRKKRQLRDLETTPKARSPTRETGKKCQTNPLNLHSLPSITSCSPKAPFERVH
ncbi:hypothetical protein WA026_015263, partial [Henosepilachna vigintioctopunctata]